jgi:hypothetical protein
VSSLGKILESFLTIIGGLFGIPVIASGLPGRNETVRKATELGSLEFEGLGCHSHRAAYRAAYRAA